MMEEVNIRQATQDDLSSLYQLCVKIGQKQEGYFEEVFEKDCVLLIFTHDEQDVGYGILNFEPKYSLYQKLEIPEIQDLNVIPEMRRQGVATALIEALEVIARDQGAEQIGISVGLTKDYGPAQILYIKQRYVPDGMGVTYDRQGVEFGRSYVVGDDLCLMMIKSL